jgi:hypothetical protein
MKNKLQSILGFFEAGLRHEQQKKTGGALDILDDSCAFALGATMRECSARGMALLDGLRSARTLDLVWRRLHEYKIARIKWHLLLLQKECPGAAHPDKEIGRASFVGYMLSERKRQSENKAVSAWLKDAHDASPAAYRAFQRWLAQPTPARWTFPLLDSWLTLVWPLVEEEGWNFQTLHCISSLKFDEDEAPALNTAKTLGKHCKTMLGLRIKAPRPGRPVNSRFDYNHPSPLHRAALAIDPSLPPDSPYAEMGK